jgi:hypothetical protein
MLICAGLMAGGGVLAFFVIPDRLAAHAPARSFCDPGAPPVQPRDRGAPAETRG